MSDFDQDQKCPSCGHRVGLPVKPGEPDKKFSAEEMESYTMFCVNCLEFLKGAKDGRFRIMTSLERGNLLCGPQGELLLHLMRCGRLAREYEKKMNQ